MTKKKHFLVRFPPFSLGKTLHAPARRRSKQHTNYLLRSEIPYKMVLSNAENLQFNLGHSNKTNNHASHLCSSVSKSEDKFHLCFLQAIQIILANLTDVYPF